jgi:uncharacterized protein
MVQRIAVFALLAGAIACSGNARQDATASLAMKGIPGQLRWKNSPESWNTDEKGLTIVAGKNTDWFISPLDRKATINGPILLFEPAADFILSAHVRVDFREQWDAGFLMIYVNDRTWAKLAIEMSAYQEPTIVSLVTQGVSDDCNSASFPGSSAYLRIARSGQALFFYWSSDGQSWRLVRTFTLGARGRLRAGFAAQAPMGDHGTAVFSDIKYEPKKISDIFRGE